MHLCLISKCSSILYKNISLSKLQETQVTYEKYFLKHFKFTRKILSISATLTKSVVEIDKIVLERYH